METTEDILCYPVCERKFEW